VKRFAFFLSVFFLIPLARAEYVDPNRDYYRQLSQQAAADRMAKYEWAKQAAREQTRINIENWRIKEEARQAAIRSYRPSSSSSSSYPSSGMSRSYSSSPSSFGDLNSVESYVVLPDGRRIRTDSPSGRYGSGSRPVEGVDTIPLDALGSSYRAPRPKPVPKEDARPVLLTILPQYQQALRSDAETWKSRWVTNWLDVVKQNLASRDAMLEKESDPYIKDAAREAYKPYREKLVAFLANFEPRINQTVEDWQAFADTELKQKIEANLDYLEPQTSAIKAAQKLWREAIESREGLQSEILAEWTPTPDSESGLFHEWNRFDLKAVLADLHAKRDPIYAVRDEALRRADASFDKLQDEKINWINDENTRFGLWRTDYEEALTKNREIPVHLQQAATKRYHQELLRRMQSLSDVNRTRDQVDEVRRQLRVRMGEIVDRALSQGIAKNDVEKELSILFENPYRELELSLTQAKQKWESGEKAEKQLQASFPSPAALLTDLRKKFRRVTIPESPYYFDVDTNGTGAYLLGTYEIAGKLSFDQHDGAAVLLAKRVRAVEFSDDDLAAQLNEPQESGWAVLLHEERIVTAIKAPPGTVLGRVEYQADFGGFVISLNGENGKATERAIIMRPDNGSVQFAEKIKINKEKEVWD